MHFQWDSNSLLLYTIWQHYNANKFVRRQHQSRRMYALRWVFSSWNFCWVHANLNSPWKTAHVSMKWMEKRNGIWILQTDTYTSTIMYTNRNSCNLVYLKFVQTLKFLSDFGKDTFLLQQFCLQFWNSFNQLKQFETVTQYFKTESSDRLIYVLIKLQPLISSFGF